MHQLFLSIKNTHAFWKAKIFEATKSKTKLLFMITRSKIPAKHDAGTPISLRILIHNAKKIARKRGLASIVIQALSRLIGIALSIFLARMLGADAFGIYAYAFAIMSLMMILGEIGVPNLLMREVAAAYSRQHWGLMRGALVRSAQVVVSISIVITIASLFVVYTLVEHFRATTFTTTIIMLVTMPVAVWGKSVAYALRGLNWELAGQSAELLLRPLFAFLIVVTAFLAMPQTRTPEFAMFSQLLGACITLTVAGWWLSRALPKQSVPGQINFRDRHWGPSTLRFTLISGGLVLNNQLDIVMLGWFAADEEVGAYRIAMQGALLVAFGIQAVNRVVSPKISALYARGEMERLQKIVSQSARLIFIFSLPIGFTMIFFGESVVVFAFGAEYGAAHLPLAILAAAHVAKSLFGPVAALLNMTGFEKKTFWAIGAAAVVNVALNLALIPNFGSTGAASASAASLLAWHTILYILTRRTIGIRSDVV